MLKFWAVQLLSMSGLFSLAVVAILACSRFFGLEPARSGERYAHLDGLRGIAAVTVVACHLTQYVVSFLGYTELPHVGNHLGILAVQVFFALTAFLFTDKALNSGLKIGSFAHGRMKRILPLYAVVVTVAIILGLFQTRGAETAVMTVVEESLAVVSYGFWQREELVLRGFNMLTLVGIAWTLSYEWAFYVLLIPAYLVWKRYPPAGYALFLMALAGAFYNFSIQPEQVIWPFFLPGIIAAFAKRFVAEVPSRWSPFLLLGALGAVVAIVALPSYWTGLKFALVSVAFLCVLYGRNTGLTWRPLQTLGTISYSIYLLQYLILAPLLWFVFGHPEIFYTGPRLIIAVSSVMIILIPVACVSYLVIEKPFLARSRLSPRDAVHA